MLKPAFNSLLRMHSRPAMLKRLGKTDAQDIYSPCRITPANYFRYLNGPEATTIRGREFIIPIDSMSGEFSQEIVFNRTPISGTYKIQIGTDITTQLLFSSTADDIRDAIKGFPGLAYVKVTGNPIIGFRVIFSGHSTANNPIAVIDSSLTDTDLNPVTYSIMYVNTPWANRLKTGDKLVDSVYNLMTVNEIIEMVDMGGAVMGFRVRVE